MHTVHRDTLKPAYVCKVLLCHYIKSCCIDTEEASKSDCCDTIVVVGIALVLYSRIKSDYCDYYAAGMGEISSCGAWELKDPPTELIM